MRVGALPEHTELLGPIDLSKEDVNPSAQRLRIAMVRSLSFSSLSGIEDSFDLNEVRLIVRANPSPRDLSERFAVDLLRKAFQAFRNFSDCMDQVFDGYDDPCSIM